MKAERGTVYSDTEWFNVQKQMAHEEFKYFLFSIRLIVYGLTSVFLALLFLVKFKFPMQWYHYLLIFPVVFSIVFFDKICMRIRKNCLK